MKAIARVWKFSSSSNPDKSYETLQYEDGTTSCQCPGWTRRVAADGSRTCKHTRSVDMGTADTECTSSAAYGTVNSVPVKMQQPVQKMQQPVQKPHEPSLVGAFKRKILLDSPAQPETPKPSELILPQLLNPINDDQVDKYLNDNAWVAEEKKDGVHKMLHKRNGEVFMTNKKGIRVAFPSGYDSLLHGMESVSLDGEEIGNRLYAFDLLELNGMDLRGMGYGKRYEMLKTVVVADHSSILLVPLAVDREAKKKLYDQLQKDNKEGIVFKRFDAPFTMGKGHQDMVKLKFYAELSARVTHGRKGKNSIGLELLNEKGEWVFMGYCTVVPSKMPIPIGSIVEIRYLNCMKGGHLYQPCYKEIRDDIDPSECSTIQIKYKTEEEN
jgi:bifunctional non-homologous end joining protein LigD